MHPRRALRQEQRRWSEHREGRQTDAEGVAAEGDRMERILVPLINDIKD